MRAQLLHQRLPSAASWVCVLLAMAVACADDAWGQQTNARSALIESDEILLDASGTPTEQPPAIEGPSAVSFRTSEFDLPASSMQNDFNRFPEFDAGLSIVGKGAALKVGGYVKADFISDFDAIDSPDSFDTASILIGAPDRQNSRFHARQTRLSFDTRWRLYDEVVRAFVETDFFGDGLGSTEALRLRHAYGTIGRLTVGKTWTTFTDPSAVPQTLDFEGAVSNVNRRQGLIRWSIPMGESGFSFAAALEDPVVEIEGPSGIDGEGRTETPDLITRLRYEQDWGEFQAAFVLRELGYQATGQDVVSGTAWGFNFTGSALLTANTKAYSQITFGEGIGSYRGSPDVVATSANDAEILPVFGWMIGVKQRWNSRLTSNFTFSRLNLDPIAGQNPENLLGTTYLAINLIQNPYERVFWGVEYLHGIRENVSRQKGDANRLQLSFGFYLP